MVQRRPVDGTRGGGGAGALLRGHDRALQGEVVRKQLHTHAGEALAELHRPAPGHVAQAVHLDGGFRHGDVVQHEPAFVVGDRPLLAGFEHDRGEAHGLARVLVGDGTAQGDPLGTQAQRERKAQKTDHYYMSEPGHFRMFIL